MASMVIEQSPWVRGRSGEAGQAAPPLSAGSGSLEGVLALLPVAGTELVGLQRVEHAQHFLRIAADAEIVRRSEADHALRIDDEGGAQRNPFLLVENAEGAAELAPDVGKPREAHLAEIGATLPPGEVNELAVDRESEELRIAVAELARDLVEAHDLGRANEGEVLGPGEHHQPLAGIAVVACRREGRFRIGAIDGSQGEGGEFVADGQHVKTSTEKGLPWGIDAPTSLIDPMNNIPTYHRISR